MCLVLELLLTETGRVSLSGRTKLYGADLPWQQGMHREDIQCLHQQQRVWKTCSVSISSKACGKHAVSPLAAKYVEDRRIYISSKECGRHAVSPPAAKHVEDRQGLHQCGRPATSPPAVKKGEDLLRLPKQQAKHWREWLSLLQ